MLLAILDCLALTTSTQELLDVLVNKETADIQTVSNWDNNTSLGYHSLYYKCRWNNRELGSIGINDLSDQSGNGQLVNISTRGYRINLILLNILLRFQIQGE